jgi:hypothetical protein
MPLIPKLSATHSGADGSPPNAKRPRGLPSAGALHARSDLALEMRRTQQLLGLLPMPQLIAHFR